MIAGYGYCTHCGRSCSCNSTRYYGGTGYFRDWDRPFGYGTTDSYVQSYTFKRPVLAFPAAWLTYPPLPYPKAPRFVILAPLARPTRVQARACRVDRNRWKRRRFLHALRRTA